MGGEDSFLNKWKAGVLFPRNSVFLKSPFLKKKKKTSKSQIVKPSMGSGYSPFRCLYTEWLVHRQHQHQHGHQGQHHCPAYRITGPPLGFLDQKFAFQPAHSQRSPQGPYFEKRYSRASESPKGLKNSGGFRTKQECRFYPYSQILQFWVCLRICFWYILESCWVPQGSQ